MRTRSRNSNPLKGLIPGKIGVWAVYMAMVACTVLAMDFSLAGAETGPELFKLQPDDSAGGQTFGFSAIDGTTVIVGAPYNDVNGDNSGSAYVFDATTGQQVFRLLPNSGADNDFFGSCVGVSGTNAIVGAWGVLDHGSVYIFDTTTGQQVFELVADDVVDGDSFGTAVDLDGTTAIVGANTKSREDNYIDAGAAYLFDTSTGLQTFKLLPDDFNNFEHFGVSVAISGTTAIVGKPRDLGQGIIDAGAAYIFDTSTGMQTFKLVADDAAMDDQFGSSVAINGTIAIVGAIYVNDNGENSGAAYLFDTTTGQQIIKLLPDDGVAWDFFGISVAISGTTAVVGASSCGDNGFLSGAAYVFKIEGAQWTQVDKLLASDGAERDFFGGTVTVYGSTAVVGAKGDDTAAGIDAGSACIFGIGGQVPVEEQSLGSMKAMFR